MRTLSSCTVLCKVASLSGRWFSSFLSRHCEDFVLLYRVMQGRVPDGTLALRQFCHGTARTLSSCTVLCKVASLSGRWLSDSFVTALRGLCPLVPCYARSRPCRDAGSQTVLSRHCEDSVLLYRVMQGRVPVGTNRLFSTILLSAYFTYFFGIYSAKVMTFSE